MRRSFAPGRIFAVVLAIIALSGCGSSSRPSFTHDYSAAQVKTVFAAKGLRLKFLVSTRRGVTLTYGRRPRWVNVTVLKVDVQLPPLSATADFRETRHGNLIVDYTPNLAGPVHTALAELH